MDGWSVSAALTGLTVVRLTHQSEYAFLIGAIALTPFWYVGA